MDKKIINKNFKACSLKKQPHKLTLNKTKKNKKIFTQKPTLQPLIIKNNLQIILTVPKTLPFYTDFS